MASGWRPCVIWLTLLTIQVTPVQSQCSGTPFVLIANYTYQTFTSPNYPFNYPNNLICIWLLQAENSTDAIRLEISDTAIEYHADCAYDAAEVFDGYNTSSDSLQKFCGTAQPVYVSEGNYLTVTFTSDYSLSFRGFKGKYKSGIRSSLLDDEEETNQIDFVVIAGAAIGGGLLLFTMCAALYACHQVKKAKRSRRVIPLEPQDALPAYQLEYIRPAPPPSYADFYASPFSPPPAYSLVDPNPQGINPSTNPNNGWVNNTQRNQNASSHDRNANTHFVRPGLFRASGNQLGDSVTQQATATLQQQHAIQSNQTTNHHGPEATQPNHPGMELARNENVFQRQRGYRAATNQQTSNPDSSQIPGHTVDQQGQSNNYTTDSQQGSRYYSQSGPEEHQMANRNRDEAVFTTSATSQQMAGDVTIRGHDNSTSNNEIATTLPDGNSNTRFRVAVPDNGPAVLDSSLGRRMSDVTDMTLPSSLCSDDLSEDENVDGSPNV